MVSPTTNKGMTWPVHGGGVGTWDGNLNANFEIIDLSFGGYYQITASSTTAAITFGTSVATIPSTAASITFSASLGTNLFYNLTGARSQNLSINMPAVGSLYIFANNSSGATTTTVLPTGGSGVTIPQGGQAAVVTTSTGANYAQNVFGAITALSLTTSSGITTTGPITQNSSQYEQLPYGDTAARPTVPSSGMFRYNSTLGAPEWWNGAAWVGPGLPLTVQRFTSGSGTCTPTAGVIRWLVTAWAGGGGGGGPGGGVDGGTGGTTTFGTWTAIGGGGGAGGAGSRLGGSGGSGGATGTGTLIDRVTGGDGTSGNLTSNMPAGSGGVNPRGGAGRGGITGGSPTAGKTNSGAGGGGMADATPRSGGGGGAGEWVSFWVNNPTATSYAIGAAGTAGGTGAAGGAGGAIVQEFYD